MACWTIFTTVLIGSFGTDHMSAGWAVIRYMHLSFMPAVGFSSFSVRKAAHKRAASETTAVADPTTVTNGVYTVKLNQDAGLIESVTNIKSGATTPLNITWGYYVSNEGDHVSGQPSGAYMFRPAEQYTHQCAANQTYVKPTLEVSAGPLVTEIKQVS